MPALDQGIQVPLAHTTPSIPPIHASIPLPTKELSHSFEPSDSDSTRPTLAGLEPDSPLTAVDLINDAIYAEEATGSRDFAEPDPLALRSKPTWRQKYSLSAITSALLNRFRPSQFYQYWLSNGESLNGETQELEYWGLRSITWFESKTCPWFGKCDASSSWTRAKGKVHQKSNADKEPHEFWTSGDEEPGSWSKVEREAREIPQYVFDYAPLIHLYSGENFWPGDIADHLIHTTPYLNYTPLQARSDHPNLTNLAHLNRWGRYVYLQSDDNPESSPAWLRGEENIPNTPEESDDHHTWRGLNQQKIEDGEAKSQLRKRGLFQDMLEPELLEALQEHVSLFGNPVTGGRSSAPVTLVVVPKPHGIVDAFWFFFYSFNLGNTVFNVRFGNHVGDWEHTLVRFQHGKPKNVFFSEHSWGDAYTYDAVEKVGKRPLGFSATGSHAMYSTPGAHAYALPYGILHDTTDRGPLWDPTLNLYSYTYAFRNHTFRASTRNPKAPVNWLSFAGKWGDKMYKISDPRQYRIFGQYHYVSGPLGPWAKNLARREVCQGGRVCRIRHWLPKDGDVRVLDEEAEGEEVSEDEWRTFVEAQEE